LITIFFFKYVVDETQTKTSWEAMLLSFHFTICEICLIASLHCLLKEILCQQRFRQ